MDPIGTPLASAAAGSANAERVAARDAARQRGGIRDGFKRALDEAELTTTETESAEAIRSMKGNAEEEAREDRQEHAHYEVEVADDKAKKKPRLDVEA